MKKLISTEVMAWGYHKIDNEEADIDLGFGLGIPQNRQ
jgi:hypothetical protein